MSDKLHGRGKIVCCRYCGRDTRSMSGICARCIGGVINSVALRDHRGERRPAEESQIPLEDDYSEESNAD